ncbi:MAG: ABC transporter permease, partial [Anaeroplasmataceae bacterium]|nr:ABC transporter permease [Anaeroplasmataceae bacterium]
RGIGVCYKRKVTILLNVLSVIFSVPLGILLGIFAALKKNKPADHVISTGIMIFISIPSFVLITLLIMLLCYKTGWLPTQFPNPTDPLSMRIKGYILPVICLSFGSICGYARFTRAELCEVMESDYLMLARTKGLTKRQAIIRHALRNAMVPIVPSILAEFIGLLSGSMIMEKLYGIPGIGDVFVRSLGEKDYNVLFSDMALYTVIGLLAGIILDLSYGFIDPRIRMGAKK